MSKPNLLNRREFLALSAAATGLGAPSRRRPNILLIVADDLGYSDLGGYGGEIDTPVPGFAGGQRPAIHAVLYHRPLLSLAGQPAHRAVSAQGGRRPHGHRPRPSGIPRTTLRECRDAGRSPEAGRIPHLHVRQVARGNPRSDASRIRAVLRHAHQRRDLLGLRAIPASSAGKQDPKLRPGYLLRHRRAHRLRAGFSAGRAHDSAISPGFCTWLINAPHFPLHARPEDISKYRTRYTGGMGRAATGAPRANEAAAAGARRRRTCRRARSTPTTARPSTPRTRRGTACRKTAARTWRCAWRSTRR